MNLKNYIIELPSEEELVLGFVTDDIGTRGCIGWVMGGFTSEGDMFAIWLSKISEYMPAAFEDERDSIIHYLDAGIMNSEFALRKYCERKRGALIGGGSLDRTYLFKIGTQKYSYFLNVQISRAECRYYIFCYENAAMREYLDVLYVWEHYEYLTTVKIFKTDKGFVISGFDYDSQNGNTSIMYLNITKTDIICASQYKDMEQFYGYLEGHGEWHRIKAGTPEFRANFDSFIKRKADYTGCTEETMNALIRSVSEV